MLDLTEQPRLGRGPRRSRRHEQGRVRQRVGVTHGRKDAVRLAAIDHQHPGLHRGPVLGVGPVWEAQAQLHLAARGQGPHCGLILE